MSAVPKWPCALPCRILREQWALEPRDPLVRTEMDNGEINTRRKLSRVPLEMPAAWELNDRQTGVFIAWWNDELDAGRAWFDSYVYDGLQCKLRRMKFVGGSPPWRITKPHNGRFILSAKLEFRDLPVLSATEREAVEIDLLYPGGVSRFDAELVAVLEAFGP